MADRASARALAAAAAAVLLVGAAAVVILFHEPRTTPSSRSGGPDPGPMTGGEEDRTEDAPARPVGGEAAPREARPLQPQPLRPPDDEPALDRDDRWEQLRKALLAAISAKKRRRVDELLDEIARFAVEMEMVPFLRRRLEKSAEPSREVREALHFALVRAAPERMRPAFLDRFSDAQRHPRMRIAALVAGIHVYRPAGGCFIYEYPYLDVRVPDPPGSGIMERALEAVRRMDAGEFPTLQAKTNFLEGLIPLIKSWTRSDESALSTWVDVVLDPERDPVASHLLGAFREHPLCHRIFERAMESESAHVRGIAMRHLVDYENYPAMLGTLREAYRSDPYSGNRKSAFVILMKLKEFPGGEAERLMREAESEKAILAFNGLVDWGGAWRRSAYEYALSGKAPWRIVNLALGELKDLDEPPFEPDETLMRRFLFDPRENVCKNTSKLHLIHAAKRFGWRHLRPLLAELADDPETPGILRRTARRVAAEM